MYRTNVSNVLQQRFLKIMCCTEQMYPMFLNNALYRTKIPNVLQQSFWNNVLNRTIVPNVLPPFGLYHSINSVGYMIFTGEKVSIDLKYILLIWNIFGWFEQNIWLIWTKYFVVGWPVAWELLFHLESHLKPKLEI